MSLEIKQKGEPPRDEQQLVDVAAQTISVATVSSMERKNNMFLVALSSRASSSSSSSYSHSLFPALAPLVLSLLTATGK
jgi:hypothetical protein